MSGAFSVTTSITLEYTATTRTIFYIPVELPDDGLDYLRTDPQLEALQRGDEEQLRVLEAGDAIFEP